MSLLDMIPQEQETVEPGRVLYARAEGEKVVYYIDKGCMVEWTRGDDSRLTREILDQRPVTFTMTDGFIYTFDKVEWVEWQM
ncbi:MAG: hypothetical protein ACXAEN_14380 [Candidatus Thorarchaeota archaeon]|jgi:hypothetical protein